MKDRSLELNELMQKKEMSAITKYIKEFINNRDIKALKRILIISRYFSIDKTANIVQYSVMMHAFELFDLLKEIAHLMPIHYFKPSTLIEWAIEHKNHYIARMHLKNNSTDTDIDIDKMLFAAATRYDSIMLKLLLNYGAKLTDKYHTAYSKQMGFEANISDEEKAVKGFQENLFTFFSASRYDRGSNLFEYQPTTDCINVIHSLGF